MRFSAAGVHQRPEGLHPCHGRERHRASGERIAKFEVPEAGAHNIWVEDGILYIAYYQGGLRIVDVSGELRGDLP